MPTYRYEAHNSNQTLVSGEIEAATVSEAVTKLETDGLSIQSISMVVQDPDSSGLGAPVTDPSRKPASESLTQHFDRILERRETLIPALEALSSELPAGRARREITQLASEVSCAHSGAELCQHENAIRWLPLLASGFAGESSSRRLSDLIAYATRDIQNRMYRRRMLAYPLAVAILAIAVLGMLCLLVVPVFDNMFQDFGLRLPTPTRWLLTFTRGIQEQPLKTIGVIAAIAAAIYAIVRVWTHFSLTTRLFGFAIAGNSASVSAMSSLTGQLAELLQMGVSVPDAIWIAGRGCENYHFRKASEQLARDAHTGVVPLRNSPAANTFPANVLHALDIDGKPNPDLLRELSTMYAQRVQRRVDWASGAMAQFSVVLVGIAVGFLVIALFLPMVSLISGLS